MKYQNDTDELETMWLGVVKDKYRLEAWQKRWSKKARELAQLEESISSIQSSSHQKWLLIFVLKLTYPNFLFIHLRQK